MERDQWGHLTGAHYAPLIDIHESGSVGTLNAVSSALTGRTHHYLSGVEASYHRVSELNERVIDIREQYPLPLEVTQPLARALRVHHPGSKKDPFPVTIDLLLTVRLAGSDAVAYVPRSVKHWNRTVPSSDVRRAALEEAACRQMGMNPWKLVTNHQLPPQIDEKTRFLFTGIVGNPEWSAREIEGFLRAMSQADFRLPLSELLEEHIPSLTGIKASNSVKLFNYLVVKRRLRIDLSLELSLDKPHPYLAVNFGKRR